MRRIEKRRGGTLVVRLLGRVEVEVDDGTPVRLGSRHGHALFALLVLTRRPRARDSLAADLWPDADDVSPAALRQALWVVRNGLVSAGVETTSILDIGPETIGIAPDARIELDVDRFEACAMSDECGTARALDLYRGDLAEGLGHDCFAAERERLSDLYEDALARAAQQRLDRGDLAGARQAAETLLARDPLREEAHATIIAVHGLTGTRSQVIRQYRRLRRVLQGELGVDPLPESEATYRVALERTFRRSLDRAAEIGAPAHPTLVALNG